MKKIFSKHWKSSKQPRKQRKYRAKAPLHIKRKLLNVNLSKELMNDAAILQRCDIAVGNDSGGMHLASCLGILSAVIFGPTSPSKFAPVGPNNIVFYRNMRCSPCRFVCNNKDLVPQNA